MNLGFVNHLMPLLAAAEESAARTAIEFDVPEGPFEWIVWGVAFVLILFALFVYLRDTAELSAFWKVWLLLLRISVVAGLVIIAINPQERTQKTSYRPSRVAILVDHSMSMQYPMSMPTEGSPSDQDKRSRSEAVRDLLSKTSLIKTLQRNHDVSFYTFDSALKGPHSIFRTTDPRVPNQSEQPRTGRPDSDQPGEEAAATDTDGSSSSGPAMSIAEVDWDETLRPRGLETRLGESLIDLIRQISGKTLSGIVIVTDGGSNAGVEVSSAKDAAKASRTRLITVGVGSTQQPVNLQVASIQAPTDVHVGDKFEISAFLQGQGLKQRQIQVELLQRPDGEDVEPTVVETRELSLLDDGVPVEVKFERDPSEAGAIEFLIRVRTSAKIRELSEVDNERRKTINIVDRKTRVLLMAGGPMRDYRFVRNMLFRHSAIELDVWLQSADPGAAVSQESDNMLLKFPDTREELFKYDVVIAFDPDWKQIPAEGIEVLSEWVFSQSGGLLLIAGDVHTSQLANADESLKAVAELYPVLLNPYLLDFEFDSESKTAWKLEFTRAGQDAGFLQLTDDPESSAATWDEFAGVYRCYPTGGVKAGATVFAYFTDPRAQTEYGQPIMLASQFYGSGRTLYCGSAEFWRLRSLDEEYYDRFWTKAIREIGQARLNRGTNRGILLLERNQYVLGQTVRVRAQLLDPQFNPMTTEEVMMEVYDPSGKPLVPARTLTRDRNRPGQFVGDFRASLPGTYRLELPIPDSREQLTEKLNVSLPNLETMNSRQNAQLLRNLAQDTGGTYFGLGDAEKEIPTKLPNRGEEFLVDDTLRTLWDRSWVMYVLIGILSVEWLTRKLLKLA